MSQTVEVTVYETDPTYMKVHPVSPHLGVGDAYQKVRSNVHQKVRSHVHQGQKAIQGRIILASRIEKKSIGEVAEGGAMPVHAIVPGTTQLNEGEYAQAALQGNLGDQRAEMNRDMKQSIDQLRGSVRKIETEMQKERDDERREINELHKQAVEIQTRIRI